jgi:hypothetical protein
MTLGLRLNPINEKFSILHVIHLVNLGLQLGLLSIESQQRG